MKDRVGSGDAAFGSIRMTGKGEEFLKAGGILTVECYDKNGKLKWRDVAHNKTPDVSLIYQLEASFTGGSAISSFYIGLTNATPVGAAGDTMASHGGWTENAAYSEANRQAWTKVRASLTLSNSASKATFSINAGGQTIGGAFITSDNTKSGSTGTLIAVIAFSGGNRSPASGDQIVVQYDYTLASTN